MATADGNAAKQSKRMLWLHRIGYFTTALVAAELLLLAFAFSASWVSNRQFRAHQMEDSRTQEGPLQAADKDIVRGSAVYLFDQLPPLGTLHGDGLRFVAMPSFNRSHFAVAIFMPQPNADAAQGVVSVFDEQNNYAPVSQRQFQMPVAAFRSLAAKLDTMTDGWPGDSTMMLDGTPTAFERVRGRRITSGIGNSDHYDRVAMLVWTYLHRFAAGEDLPTRGDWEPADKR